MLSLEYSNGSNSSTGYLKHSPEVLELFYFFLDRRNSQSFHKSLSSKWLFQLAYLEERVNLATSSPSLLQNLTSLLLAYQATKFQTSDIPGYGDCVSLAESKQPQFLWSH